jgi:hypothetical protein
MRVIQNPVHDFGWMFWHSFGRTSASAVRRVAQATDSLDDIDEFLTQH